MVQYGIFLVVVVMKINIKKVVPPIRGVCGGECQEVHVLLHRVPQCTLFFYIINAYFLNLK